ncbi:MAG: hypothetical protein SF002_17810 [Alphaproteobacteria bacterium]|nr:hypothetical protein [Alphaproteobacteria bacterium]
MRPIKQGVEPPDYAIRRNSLEIKDYLANLPPNPPSDQWAKDNKQLWQGVQDEVWAWNEDRCVYSDIYCTPGANGIRSVDHFLPKTLFPQQSLDWDNYLPCQTAINRYKDTTLGFVDPRTIPPTLFKLVVPKMATAIADTTSPLADAGQTTIKNLRLDRGNLIEGRRMLIKNFLKELDRQKATILLKQHSRFLFDELARQGFCDDSGQLTARGLLLLSTL